VIILLFFVGQRGQDPFSPKFQCTAFTEVYSSKACFPSSRPFNEIACQSKPNSQEGQIPYRFRSVSSLQTERYCARCCIGSPRPIRKKEWKPGGSSSEHRASREAATGPSLTVPASSADETRMHWFASAKETKGGHAVRAYIPGSADVETSTGPHLNVTRHQDRMTCHSQAR